MKVLGWLLGLLWTGWAHAGGSSTILSSWNCDGNHFFLVDLTCAGSIDSLIEDGDGLELKGQQDDSWMFFPLEMEIGPDDFLVIRGEDSSQNMITIISRVWRSSNTHTQLPERCD